MVFLLTWVTQMVKTGDGINSATITDRFYP
jgi:hypothetical protein